MAASTLATVGVRVDVDNPVIRQRALELAIDTRPHVSEGAESIIKRAEVFAAFIDGKTEAKQ